jgi:hypothetical protein
MLLTPRKQRFDQLGKIREISCLHIPASMDFEPIVAARPLPIERRDGNLRLCRGHRAPMCRRFASRLRIPMDTHEILQRCDRAASKQPGGLSHSQTELAAHAAVIPFGPAAPLRRPDPADQARCRPLTQFPKNPLLAYHYRLKQQPH